MKNRYAFNPDISADRRGNSSNLNSSGGAKFIGVELNSLNVIYHSTFLWTYEVGRI